MRVLLSNKFFYPKGGDAIAFFNTAALLEKHGHEPIFFSMEHPRNTESPFSRFFVANADLNAGGGALKQLRMAANILYSFEAKRKINRLIDEYRPDIAHLHNICHQISPSVIDALKARAIPVVMTLHDYKLTCAAYTLLAADGVCERCSGGRYYHGLLKKCTKGSAVKSLINAAEMYLHHRILKIYEKVDAFISPSRFLLERTKQMGFKGRIEHLPNFIDASAFRPSFEAVENGIVYFGRLTREKGLLTLIEAVKGLPLELKIIGEGPQKEELERKTVSDGMRNVRFLGFRSGEDLHREIRSSMFVVVPSEWYENNPLAIIEAFALGKPVAASRIGGIPELVRDGQTGFTFQPGNALDIREKIKAMAHNRRVLAEMGKKARLLMENELAPAIHYGRLMDIYRNVMK